MKRLLLTGLGGISSSEQSKGNVASVSESETTDTYVSTVRKGLVLVLQEQQVDPHHRHLLAPHDYHHHPSQGVWYAWP